MLKLKLNNGVWPIRAHQWQGSVPGWSKASSQTRGDIVSNGVHCGIAVSSQEIISAGREKVSKHGNIAGATIQRCD